MNNTQKSDESFTYTYSAKRQEEIRKIKEKYAPQSNSEDKMERLRRLDKSTTRPGTVASTIVGTIGTLVMGLGMTCTTEWSDTMFVLGIVLGVVGIGLICFAYPLYNAITKHRRKKLAPEILRLTEELEWE